MSTSVPEFRTPVMIVVEVSWEQQGAIQKISGRMEDKSTGGACIRLRKLIPAGSKVGVQWRFEQFSGTVKYCRPDDQDFRDFLIGIQRDTTKMPLSQPQPPESRRLQAKPPAPQRQPQEIKLVEPTPEEIMPRGPALEIPNEKKIYEIPLREPEASLLARTSGEHKPRRSLHEYTRDQSREHTSGASPDISYQNESATPRQSKVPEPPKQEKERARERKSMARKWLGLSSWGDKPDEPKTTNSEISVSHTVKSAATVENNETPMPPSPQVMEKSMQEAPGFEAELLGMEDIYVSAGIMAPRKGYSVKKVVEMLNSEHIHSLPKELKRAAVLMALDSAGIAVEEIQRDAKMRHDALNAYEAERKKQVEADWARRGDEIAHIQTELESIKAHYISRINRNLEIVARDKTRLSSWQSMKQEETQAMTEAVELCSNQQTSDTATPTPDAPSAASAPKA